MARLYIVSVPEAAVHEDGGAVLAHHDVGFAGHALHVEAVAVAVPPKPTAYLQLGLSVLAVDARHAIMPLLGCHRVGHGRILLVVRIALSSGWISFHSMG